MPLTQQVIDNVANAALDFHLDKGKVHNQHIQEKPLLRALKANQKTFPGGKGEITVRPVFETQSTIEGFDSDDTLNFTNPTPIKTARYPFKLIHCGIEMTMDELLRDGVSVVDTNGQNTKLHNQRELTVLANTLETKLADMSEGYSAGMNTMLWRDGTQDAKEIPGIRYFITNNPAVGIVGGIDRANVVKWRNLADLAINPAATPLIRRIQQKVRQIRRYGSPKHLILCGSDFLDQLEKEVYDKGSFTQTGFSGKRNVGIGALEITGLGTFEYDPTLDDLTLAKYAFFIDLNAIKLMPIEGEDMKKHFPARPHNKMVVYRSVTFAGALVAKQLNTSMVMSIA
jgi:hypothetical protein